MTKKDLKNGMIVELRNGTRYLYCEGVMRGRGLDGWDLISNYTDNLKIPEFPRLDIVKVYKDTKAYDLSTIFEYEYLELIWQRPELSEREIEILKALDLLNYKFLARDYNENKLYAYFDKPEHHILMWIATITYFQIESNLFTFITWADEKPTSIQELLSDFEKEKKDE